MRVVQMRKRASAGEKDKEVKKGIRWMVRSNGKYD